MDQSSLAAVSGVQSQNAASKTLAATASSEAATQTEGSFMGHVLSRMASNSDDSNAETTQKKAQTTQATQPSQTKTSTASKNSSSKNTQSQSSSAQSSKPNSAQTSAKPAPTSAKDKQAAAQNAKSQSASSTNSTQTSQTSSQSSSTDNSDETGSTSDTTDAEDAQAAAQTQVATAQDPSNTQTTTTIVVVTSTVGTVASDTTAATLTTAGKKKLSQMIDSLLNMLPGDQKQAALTQLQNMLGQSSPSLSANGTDPGQALIAAGLSPQQLTDLIGQLKQMTGGGQSGLDLDQLSLGAVQSPTGAGSDTNAAPALPATVQLTAPPLKRDAIFSPRSATPAAASKNLAASLSDDDDTTADTTSQVNALTTTGSSGSGASGSNLATAPNFDSVMKVFEHMQDSAQMGGQTNAAAAGLAKSAGEAANAAAAATVQNATTGTATNALTTTGTGTSQTFPDGSDWASKQGAVGAMTPMAGLSVTGAASMTSLVNNSSLATAAHPAMQVIATSIMAAGEDGDDKDITVKLDPAELGKVQVKMTIAKDNTTTAHILVEKPETYLMLQRDQHVLSRALQNSGLDVNGNSLSFELAQNGMNFAQNNGNGNSGNGTGSSASDGETGTVLETTMNWSVDPTSGQTHYNLLA